MDKFAVDALFFESDVDLDWFLDYYIIGEKENYYENRVDHYNFYSCAVPRVSNILKETIYDESLIDWYKRTGSTIIDNISNAALRVGSIVHMSIERFIYNTEHDVPFNPAIIPIHIIKENNVILTEHVLDQIFTSYDNFCNWWKNMHDMGYTIHVLDIERPTVNPWYGGTIDCIMQISKPNEDIKTFIIDFKTSKKITINYWLQTYAYYWSYCWEDCNIVYPRKSLPRIDGIGILRLPKDNDKVQFETLDFTKDYEQNTAMQLHYALRDMVHWYYSKHNIEKELIT